MTNIKRRSLNPDSKAADILLEIGRYIEDIHFTLARPSLVIKFGLRGARQYLKRKDDYERNRALKRLQERKLLKIEKIADQYHVAFSQAGLAEYLRIKLLKSDLLPKGQVCIVVFDIPESHRVIRKQLRRLLAAAAFIPIQRSVWISNVDAGDFLKKLFCVKGQKRWVKIYTGKEN